VGPRRAGGGLRGRPRPRQRRTAAANVRGPGLEGNRAVRELWRLRKRAPWAAALSTRAHCPHPGATLAAHFPPSRGLAHYRLDGWVTEHVATQLEISNVYRWVGGVGVGGRRLGAVGTRTRGGVPPHSSCIRPPTSASPHLTPAAPRRPLHPPGCSRASTPTPSGAPRPTSPARARSAAWWGRFQRNTTPASPSECPGRSTAEGAVPVAVGLRRQAEAPATRTLPAVLSWSHNPPSPGA
jgi:hypothetical protein